MTRVSLAIFCRKLTLAFVCCLPFLVPFGDAPRNIDMQGLILLLAGIAGWAAALADQNFSIRKLYSPTGILLFAFIMSCLLSLAVNPNISYNIFGAPYIRLGAAGLLACGGCGLALRQVADRQLTLWLYIIIFALAVVAIPYSWLHLHSLGRIGSLFAQADIFAVFLGCGLLIGVQLLQRYKAAQNYLVTSQVLLFSLLVLSGTRVMLFLTILLLPIYWQQIQHHRVTWRYFIYIAAAVLLLIIARPVLPQRITNINYADESFHYRLDLQTNALQATHHKPAFGYGPGNLADALNCSHLTGRLLQKTCHEGYFFNSSHNIFLDRILGIGWLGGSAYVLIVGLAAYRGIRGKAETRVLGYAVLLIGSYYFTNVTSLTLELLLWILVLKCLFPVRVTSHVSA